MSRPVQSEASGQRGDAVAATKNDPVVADGTVRHLVVPIDGSPESWHAFDVAMTLARRCAADVRLVSVVFDPAEVRTAEQRLDDELTRRPTGSVDISFEVRLTHRSVASEIDAFMATITHAVIVMSSLGRGRSAAILGSVAHDLLTRTAGPIVIVGPGVTLDERHGPIVVSVDGSPASEAALPVASSWARVLRTSVRIVTVSAARLSGMYSDDVVESGYLARLASQLRRGHDHDVDFDVLHRTRPGRAVVEDAERTGAMLIVASSYGRGGAARVVLGSTAAEFVRRATCPVVVLRPSPTADDAHRSIRRQQEQSATLER